MSPTSNFTKLLPLGAKLTHKSWSFRGDRIQWKFYKCLRHQISQTPSPGSQAVTQVLKLSWWQNSMKISRANNRVKIVFQCFGELLLFNLEDVLVVLPHHQHTLKLGTELVPETSENLLILTQLSAGRKFNWSWCIVYRRTERHDDANRRTERHDDANRLN